MMIGWGNFLNLSCNILVTWYSASAGFEDSVVAKSRVMKRVLITVLTALMPGSVVFTAEADAALVTPSLAFCKRLNQVAVRLKRTGTERAQARVARNSERQERANRSRSLNVGCGAKRVKKAVLPSTREYCASPRPVYRPIIKGRPLR